MKCGLFIDTEECVGCHACEIACKQEHELPVGPRLIKIYDTGPQRIEGRPQLRYKVAVCLQCTEPPCRDACPVGAISLRKDGITVINRALCDGCRKCIDSCPYGVLEFDAPNKLARKCDLCAERLDRGLNPACIATCPSHCIHFSTAKMAGI